MEMSSYCRCYNCEFYEPRNKTKGYCKDLKTKVDAVDFCNEGKPKEIEARLDAFKKQLEDMIKPIKEGETRPYVPLTVEGFIKMLLGDEK